MRRLCILLAAACLVAWPAMARAATPPVPPPAFHGRAAAVIDGDTMQVIWQDNGEAELPMASLTKIMTALISLHLMHGHLDAPMVVPPQVRQVYGEMVYLTPGNVYTFRQMLDAMLIQSANDAAVTIAVASAGSQAAFVRLMNERAAQMGLWHTHYVNVHGLDAPGHYSSALDLARLGALAMRNPVFARFVDKRHATIPWPGHGVETLDNHNYLLSGYPGATGVKIGYTSLALNCVVGSAVRDGHEIVAVAMGERRGVEWRDESALLNYGFAMLPHLPPPPPPPAIDGPSEPPPQKSVSVPVSRPQGRPWVSYLGLAALAVAAVLASRRPR